MIIQGCRVSSDPLVKGFHQFPYFLKESSLEERLACGVELLEDTNGIFGEVRHVFGHEKAKVVQVVLLLEDHVVAELLRKPSDVFSVRETVEGAREQGRRYLVVFERNERGLVGAIDLLVRHSSVVVLGEPARVNHLGVVDECAVAGA